MKVGIVAVSRDYFPESLSVNRRKALEDIKKAGCNALCVYLGNFGPEISETLLAKLAQYELTLLDWVEEHRGYRKYVAIAGKCWPTFQTQFGFVPCYVNSRLTGRGVPVSCEADIKDKFNYTLNDTFMGFHCGNIFSKKLSIPMDIYRIIGRKSLHLY